MSRLLHTVALSLVLLVFLSGLALAEAAGAGADSDAASLAATRESQPRQAWDEVLWVEVSLGALLEEDAGEYFASLAALGGRTQVVGPFGWGFRTGEVFWFGDDEGRVWQSLAPPVYVHFVPFVTWAGSAEDDRTHFGTVADFYVGGSPIAAIHSDAKSPESDGSAMESDWWWNWYARGGLKLTFGGDQPRAGVDLGAIAYNSDGDSAQVSVGEYAAFHLYFGSAGRLW